MSSTRTKTRKSKNAGMPALRRARKSRRFTPIWEELVSIARSIPDSNLNKLPTDLAEKHDHYLRGNGLS